MHRRSSFHRIKVALPSCTNVEQAFTFSFPIGTSGGFLDGQVVDAGEAALHVAEFVELPVLVAVGAIPLAGVIVEFILETHGDAVATEAPEFFLKSVAKFAIPFAAQEFDDLRPAMG